MILERLDLKAYGLFSDESLDLSAGPRRFHLVYGPNESGKSTCLRAISALLFGIPTRTTDSFLHSNAKLRVGATLLGPDGNRLTVIRRKNGKTKLHAEDDKTPIDPMELEQMLGGIDEAAFHHRFGLSHEQLVAGGQAVLDSKGELGEILFAAGAGVGRLKAIQTELENESKELFLERGKKRINGLLSELDEKRKIVRELQTPPAEYQLLKRQLAEAEQQSQALADERTRLAQSLARQKAVREAHAIVPVWRRHKAQLETLSSVPTLDEDFAARRREASANRQTYQRLVDQLRREIEATEKKIDSCLIDPATIEHESEIVALFQGIAAREAASKDQANLHRVVKNRNRHLRELLRDLEIDIADDAPDDNVDRVVDKLHVSDAAQIRINELAGDCEMLRQQERDSLESLQTLRKQLAELDDELERHPDIADPAMIESVLAEIGPPATLLDQADQERSSCRELESQCERLMRELRLGQTDLDDAAHVQPPTAAEIDDHDQTLHDRSRAVQDARKAVATLRQQLHDAGEKLTRLQADQPLPTEQELAQSRETRDQWVDRLASARADEENFQTSTRQVRQSIRTADDVVDTIRSHQKQVTERAAVTQEMARLKDAITAAEEAVDQAERLAAEASQQWNQLWESCGIAAGKVREMRNWVAKHQTFVEKFRTLEKERTRLDSTQTRIARHATRLAHALQNAWSARPVSVGHDETSAAPDDPMNLESLHDRATVLRNELVAAASQLEQIRRKRNEIHAALPAAEAKYESNAAKRKQWDSDWKQAIASFASDQDVSPSVISMRLKKIAKLFEETRERDIILGRIRSIDDDGRSFAERATVVARIVGLECKPDQQSVEIAQALYERLQAAKNAANQAERFKADLTAAKARLVDDNQVLEAAVGQLAQLCREAGVDHADELPGVEQNAAEKRTALQACARAEEQLALIAGGVAVEQFARQVESHDRVELEHEIDKLEESLQTLNERWSTVEQRVGAFKKELSRIDGGDRAAELNQELQLLYGTIQRESQQYAKLRIASMILQQSIEHYRSENESPVLKIACQAFEELTCGRYAGLKPEFDDKGRSKLFGIAASPAGEENLVPVDAMSLGTADALYLAMRLASLEHQLSAGHAIPVVIDDCLIQLDDQRTIAAMKRFSKLSERTQVILFTHHQHLIDLAQSALEPEQFHLHRLAR
ncbi:Chromosome partition protein Smc [Stieleria neptunia]|uniref:Chromosome partition protein Smc n=1 Tax=Stieleria neptunia TaxID=2527979 RepID=A0A518HWM4_9BACT|nr:YhaN family protein [Stieleria neptunia]QDV45164.1 Chromosome partition protein Smc [Stieleria neptunia]